MSVAIEQVLLPEKATLKKGLLDTLGFLEEHFEETLLSFSDEEAKVFRLWIGREDGRTHTQEEIAQVLGVFPGYIYLMEFVILRKIRAVRRRRKLLDFLD